jgi:hypothetical protein
VRLEILRFGAGHIFFDSDDFHSILVFLLIPYGVVPDLWDKSGHPI